MKHLAIALLIVVTTPFVAFSNGSELLLDCKTTIAQLEGTLNLSDNPKEVMETSFRVGYTMGLIQGAKSGLLMYWMGLKDGKDTPSCFLDKNPQDLQLLKILERYLEQHPEKLHQNSVKLMLEAFWETCEKQAYK